MTKEGRLDFWKFEIITINGVDYMKVKDAREFVMETYGTHLCNAYRKALKESKIEELFDSCIVEVED